MGWGIFNAIDFASFLILSATLLHTLPDQYLRWVLPVLHTRVLTQLQFAWPPQLFGYASLDDPTTLLLTDLLLRLTTDANSAKVLSAGWLCPLCLAAIAQIFYLNSFPLLQYLQ